MREANETLRQSEEHLRLVFETAEDGIVELDERGVVLRANEAFAGMISLPRESIEDQPWTALASVVVGADDAFPALRIGRAIADLARPTARCCISSRAHRRCRRHHRAPCCWCAT